MTGAKLHTATAPTHAEDAGVTGSPDDDLRMFASICLKPFAHPDSGSVQKSLRDALAPLANTRQDPLNAVRPASPLARLLLISAHSAHGADILRAWRTTQEQGHSQVCEVVHFSLAFEGDTLVTLESMDHLRDGLFFAVLVIAASKDVVPSKIARPWHRISTRGGHCES